LTGCNVSITDGRNLWCTPLRWFHAAWYTYQISWRLVRRSSNIKILSQTFERLWCWYYWWEEFMK
jgi:hypothetical protein